DGGSVILVTRKPLMKPVSAPTAMPRMIASTPGTPLLAAVWAITIWARMAAAPTDKSMPAVRMIMVWPMARVASTATCWIISDRFVALKNLGLIRENTMTDATSTLAGPIVGCR